MARKRPRSERFFAVETATMSPGQDWLTKSAVGPFVDTKVDVQFGERGRIYLSHDTVRELAVAAGILDEYLTMIDEAEEVGYNNGYAEAIKENYGTALTDAVDRLSFVAGQLGLALAPRADGAPEVIVGGEEPAGGSSDSQQSEDAGGVTGGEQGSATAPRL